MNATPPAVRILPMNRQEFVERDIQHEFFLVTLVSGEREGKYHYRTRGLNAKPDTMVLFQLENRIIASSVFLDSRPFDQPTEQGYLGDMYFDTSSIRIFAPLGLTQISAIWPNVTGFSHVRWILDPTPYPEFEKILTGVRWAIAR